MTDILINQLENSRKLFYFDYTHELISDQRVNHILLIKLGKVIDRYRVRLADVVQLDKLILWQVESF